MLLAGSRGSRAWGELHHGEFIVWPVQLCLEVGRTSKANRKVSGEVSFEAG